MNTPKSEETSSHMVKRVIKYCIYCLVVIAPAIFLFTFDFFYSIIFLLGTLISIVGFLVMIKMIDRVLSKGKGRGLFFLAAFAKLAVISLVFYLASRVSGSSVLFYILGLSVIFIAILFEGIYQFRRSRING